MTNGSILFIFIKKFFYKKTKLPSYDKAIIVTVKLLKLFYPDHDHFIDDRKLGLFITTF